MRSCKWSEKKYFGFAVNKQPFYTPLFFMFNMIEKIDKGTIRDKDAVLAVLVAKTNELIEAANLAEKRRVRSKQPF